jgi:V/A-type H+-transporting ATPase subunit D
MAGRLKKNNPELLQQRRDLERYNRYLPTLLLKRRLIQTEILRVRRERAELNARIERRIEECGAALGVLAEGLPGPLTRFVSVAGVRTGERNFAGVGLPVLEEVDFDVRPYSLRNTPSWVEAGTGLLKELLAAREALRVTIAQELVLELELRKVTQRVNLFEKVKIPEARENIRVIRIALAEEQIAAIGCAKIAKAKKSPAVAGAAL